MRQAIQRKVTGPTVPFRKPVQVMSEHVNVARHGHAHDEVLGFIHEIVIQAVAMDELRVHVVQRRLVCALHKVR